MGVHMSFASFNTAGTLEESEVKPRARWWRGPRFFVEVFDGADEALAALEAVQGGLTSQSALTSTAFQTLNWLTVFYEELAPKHRARPRLVVVTERNSGEVALILPLVIKRKRTLRVARFADLGVADYGAPILGPALLKKRRSIRRAWRAIRHALRDVDLIRLENMPAEIGGIANPLITRSGLAPSRRTGSVIYVRGTVDEYIAGRGKKYRKEVERCTRLWEKEGTPHFARATDPDEIARVYSVLEEQQAARHAALGSKYILKQESYRQFYERLVMDGSEVDLGHLFHLEAGGETIATLFGVLHDGTFTMLRIADAGEAWSHISPGRLICIEVMRYFVERDCHRFDLGLGDNPFKRGFGADEVPLYDLIVARDLAAVPSATFHRVKGRARKNQRLRAFARSVARLWGG